MSSPSRLTRIYRATYFQAVLIGFLSFTQPGIWSAIAGLGAGGLQSVTTSNSASAILFAIMFFFSPVFGILINKWGIKPIINIGTVGYVFWSAGLYKNSKDGSQALITAGATLCGISAAAFWTGEATVAILYPEQNQRGLFIGTWQVLNKIGGLIAGAISLALNINDDESGGVSLNTYVVLLSIQCLGFPASFLLSPPEKVIRSDGTKLISNVRHKTLKEEARTFLKVLKRKEVLGLAPLFISVVWFNSWQSNYITNHFSVRARSLNSLLSALIGGATDIVAGQFLDTKYIRRSLKVKGSWVLAVALMTGFFIYSLVLQHEFDVNPEEGIDWKGNARFARAFIPFQIFKISGEFIFNWTYWVIGAYQFSSEEIPHVSGIIRSLESLGQCLAFVITVVNTNDMTSLIASVVIFFLSVIPASYIVSQVTDEEITGREEYANEESDLEAPAENIDVVITAKED
ncbi:putative notoamide biosynthesis cluster protein O' [[Candida] railenensis]|uniref:Notoamide biosynthesis cluster protein O n=1 Tax=[Candida] railenensis TaxID=45579 RepID=A0A9P0QVS2_9ASCO|nr:putative notoamide biosynthesis cluster protein O' [[Candida] railenensis]